MADKEKINDKEIRNKAAKVVALRNRFFYTLYRYSTLVFMTSLICMAFAIFFLVFFARQPVPPQYIPINEDGTYIKLEPLSVCKEDREVQRFVADAINKLYKYDYINYPDQLMTAAPYFTDTGWDNFLGEFNNSGTLLAVKENKWVVSVTPSSIPEITKKGVEEGVCQWDLKTSLSLLYIGNHGSNPRGDLYVRLKRVSVILNPQGLGIERLVFVPT